MAKGGFLWNVVWPKGIEPRYKAPKHLFKPTEDWSELLSEE